ncbi:MAG: hypothetical protein KZQ95_11855 [Candidatus Thiodiazotropha sp. (ex Epidulcina cf. delphinae)]|nr:hypothetical protein [Candidatus Thiodiazotropha sp. (ex Epidulcina cf. delphinae)]
MLDVRIRQCRLRVVRHGGWSWGVDRQGLIDMASDRVPALIAEVLAHLPLESKVDSHIDKLTVRLRSRPDTLSAVAFDTNSAVSGLWRASLEQQLREQIASDSPQLILQQNSDQPLPDVPARPTAAATSNIQLLLRAWLSDGSLAHHLRRFTLQALSVWERAWLRLRRSQAAMQEGDTDHDSKQRLALIDTLPHYGEHPRGVRQSRLHLLAALDLHSAGQISAADAQAQLDRLFPIVTSGGGETSTVAPDELMETVPTETDSMPQRQKIDRLSAQQGRGQPTLTPVFSNSDIDTHVASALPYLILGTLHQLGYPQAVSATLESEAACSLAHCLSAALASKLLPVDGEMDCQAKRHLIATFSLTELAPSPQAFAQFEHLIGSALSAADAGIYAGLLSGHTAGTPLLVCERNPGWMLFDTQGMFPLTQGDGSDDLKASLQPFLRSVVMVPSASLSQALVDTILDSGGAFVTDAMPARGEAWIAVDRARRFHAHPDHPVPSACVRHFDACQTVALKLLEDYLPARRLLPELPFPAIDTSTELAAGAGLADLAYRLWGDRESTHPLLAYERLHDLEARVRVDQHRVRVSLALGQRYFDLRDKGVLHQVAGVPWFAGRTLDFSGL